MSNFKNVVDELLGILRDANQNPDLTLEDVEKDFLGMKPEDYMPLCTGRDLDKLRKQQNYYHRLLRLGIAKKQSYNQHRTGNN